MCHFTMNKIIFSFKTTYLNGRLMEEEVQIYLLFHFDKTFIGCKDPSILPILKDLDMIVHRKSISHLTICANL